MGGWHKDVTLSCIQKRMLSAGGGRAQCQLLRDHLIVPTDWDAHGDWYPQFRDPHPLWGHRERL